MRAFSYPIQRILMGYGKNVGTKILQIAENDCRALHYFSTRKRVLIPHLCTKHPFEFVALIIQYHFA